MRSLMFAGAVAALSAPLSWAQSEDVITVQSARIRALEAGTLADTIQQTELIDAGDLKSAQVAVLSEALHASPGVRVNNECSMCGVKRVMLNGLGGQHTTILVDGLPAHTLVSGFYGPDALSVAGVERIEIARGAGASLTAPEAIGGSVNVVTLEPTDTGGEFDIAGGENGYFKSSLVGHYASEDGRVRGLAFVQLDERDQYDGDGNGVSEHPLLENVNYGARLSFDPDQVSTFSLRLSRTESEIFGGPVIGDNVGSISQALFSFDDAESDALFVGDTVNGDYIGKPWETAEWINTQRNEISARYFREFGANLTGEAAVSWSDHTQDSFYEGFDYKADNEMVFVDARVHWAINDQHLITFGVDSRDETMRSQSDAAAGDPAYVSDSFDYLTYGVFIQDSWTPSEVLDIALAVRVDKIEADFVDPSKPGVEIDKTLISPRLDARYQHSDRWESRVSVGQGYRAPLSFFETDHGILDGGVGFQIEVDELERSVSTSYALSYLGDRLTATGAIAWTSVENLAALDETDAGVPLLTQREGEGTATAITFDAGYALSDTLQLSMTAETFDHDDTMRSIFGVAAIEKRVTLGAEWTPGAFDIDVNASWAGERDLADYGYEGFDDTGASLAKPLEVDAYWTLDARAAYQVNAHLNVYAGGRNLTGFTQVEDDGISPLFYDADGGYDVGYIYGPLRGRELYAGISAEF